MAEGNEAVVVENDTVRGIELDDDAKAVKAYMESKNIPIRFADEDDTDSDEGEEPEEAPVPESEIPTQEFRLPPEGLDLLAKELLALADPAKAGYERREERRRAKLEEENDRLRDAFNDLVATVREGTKAPAQAAAPEEEIDFFVDPEKGAKRVAQKEVDPLKQELAQLKQMVQSLTGQLRVSTFQSAEESYAAKNQDYLPALKEYREGTYTDMKALGLSDEDAMGYLQQMDQGILMLAEKAKKPAFQVAHEMAKRGNAARKALVTPAPAAPAPLMAVPPAPQSAKLMQGGSRARQSNLLSQKAAAMSPEAASLSGTGQSGASAADSVLDGTLDIRSIKGLLDNRKTRGDFYKLVDQVEARAMADRRR